MSFNFLRTNFNGDPNLGLFGRASNKYCILGIELPKIEREAMSKALGVDVHKCTLAGTELLGIFCSGNNTGLVVTKLADKEELTRLKKILGINIEVINSRETAIGNLVLCNDNGCIISPTLVKFKKQISDALGVEVDLGTLDDFNLVGSSGMASNVGCLCHMSSSEHELQKVKDILKVRTDVGTVAYGTPYIKAGVIVNSNGII
ncbi:MAG: translation initiation factor IF-6, partial [Candidatus Aenigmarchaeota archaeon]|nr:translation initiation factor IF-6 [Candidatus Aenigmarchaeota archaeon]